MPASSGGPSPARFRDSGGGSGGDGGGGGGTRSRSLLRRLLLLSVLVLLLLAAPSRVNAGPTDADDDTVDDVLAQLTQVKEISQNRLEGESLMKELQVRNLPPSASSNRGMPT